MHNILLIGGAGFIGANLVSHLLKKKDYSIVVMEPEFASLHRIAGMRVKVYRCQLCNIDEINVILRKEKINTVVHLVSTIIPGSNFDDYQGEFTNVIFPSIKLMEICCEYNIKFVYFSSGGTVYGDRKGEITPFKENDQMAPVSYYGWSKQMMENSIQYMHRTRGLQYLVLRPSNPYGRNQSLYGKQGFIAVALGKLMAGEKIQVWGDGSAVRDYIYIDDLSDAVVDLLSIPNVANMTLNIGSGKGYSINQIIGFIRNVVKEKVGVEYFPARQVDVSSVILDTSLLRNFVDFNPIEIQEGIKLFYDDVKNG